MRTNHSQRLIAAPTARRLIVAPTARRLIVTATGLLAGLTVLAPLAAADSPAAAPQAAAALGVHGDARQATVLLGQLAKQPQVQLRAQLTEITDRLAGQAAIAVGADVQQMRAAWRRADDTHLRALMRGITALGVRYRSLGSSPSEGFDCSGFTSFAWKGAGVTLARQSGDQLAAAGQRNVFTAQAGDLVYYPGHVMLYLGVGNYVLHSPYSGEVVRFDTTGHVGRLRFGDPTE